MMYVVMVVGSIVAVTGLMYVLKGAASGVLGSGAAAGGGGAASSTVSTIVLTTAITASGVVAGTVAGHTVVTEVFNVNPPLIVEKLLADTPWENTECTWEDVIAGEWDIVDTTVEGKMIFKGDKGLFGGGSRTVTINDEGLTLEGDWTCVEGNELGIRFDFDPALLQEEIDADLGLPARLPGVDFRVSYVVDYRADAYQQGQEALTLTLKTAGVDGNIDRLLDSVKARPRPVTAEYCDLADVNCWDMMVARTMAHHTREVEGMRCSGTAPDVDLAKCNERELIDGREHAWDGGQTDKIKGAYIGLTVQYGGNAVGRILNESFTKDQFDGLMRKLKERGYNKVYFVRGGIRIDESGNITADIPEIHVPLQLPEELGMDTELVFGVNEASFQNLLDTKAVPEDFDAKTGYYVEHFRAPQDAWVSAHDYLGSENKKVHLNLESYKHRDAEAATIALIRLFKEDGWSVSISVVDTWTAETLAMMIREMPEGNGTGELVYQAYNITAKKPGDLLCKVDRIRKNVEEATNDPNRLVLALPYYWLDVPKCYHPNTENLALYTDALKTYRYLERLGGGVVWDYIEYDIPQGVPLGDNAYFSAGHFYYFDNLYIAQTEPPTEQPVEPVETEVPEEVEEIEPIAPGVCDESYGPARQLQGDEIVLCGRYNAQINLINWNPAYELIDVHVTRKGSIDLPQGQMDFNTVYIDRGCYGGRPEIGDIIHVFGEVDMVSAPGEGAPPADTILYILCITAD